MSKRPEIDRWILSELNSLIKNVDMCYADYEPTKAGRLINDFVMIICPTGMYVYAENVFGVQAIQRISWRHIKHYMYVWKL